MPVDKKSIVYSVPDAAELLGMSPQTLRKAIKNGKVKAAMVGRVQKLSSAELAKYWKDIGGGDLFIKGDSDKSKNPS